MPENFARHQFAGLVTSSLVLTMIPWHPKLDEDGKWQKVPSLAPGFHYRDFEYGKPVVPFDQWGWRYDRWGCKVPCDDRPGYVTSFESGVITVDDEDGSFLAWLESIGIILPPTAEVSTGKPRGRHYVFDGRHLTREQWPVQRNYWGMGDIKSHGFCAAPGAEHPSGRMYKLDRPAQPAHWGADWGRLLDEAWAARGRGTSGHGGGSDGGEGDGRNCELYDLKKQLFYQQGIDEDDPEIAERILAANAEFAVPLRESEVWNTILKIKGWRRHGHHGAGLAVSEEDQELAEAKARLLAAFSPEGISAGRASVRSNEENPFIYSSEQSPELGFCHLLTAAEELRAKRKAELDEHELSKDWLGRRKERDCYEWAITEAIIGKEVRRDQIEDQVWAILTEVAPNGAFLCREDEHGVVQFYSDPDGNMLAELLGGEPEPHPEYPGCPEEINPKAGRYLGQLGEIAVMKAWQEHAGKRTTDRTIARWVNEHREMLGLQGRRYLSADNAGRIRRMLFERGDLLLVMKEEHYRKMHKWRTLAGAYEPAPDDQRNRFAGMTPDQAANARAFEEIARTLREQDLRYRLEMMPA